MPEKGNSSQESPTGDDATGAEEVEAAPDGIEPLFFSSKTQEIFECVIDSDVTAENPHKLIPKEKIVADFKNRAAISDFHPVKQRMLVRNENAIRGLSLNEMLHVELRRRRNIDRFRRRLQIRTEFLRLLYRRGKRKRFERNPTGATPGLRK